MKKIFSTLLCVISPAVIITPLCCLSGCSTSQAYVNLMTPYEPKINPHKKMTFYDEENDYIGLSCIYTDNMINNADIFADDLYYSFSTALTNDKFEKQISKHINFSKFGMNASFLGLKKGNGNVGDPTKFSFTFKIQIQVAGTCSDVYVYENKTQKLNNFDICIDLFLSGDYNWFNNCFAGSIITLPLSHETSNGTSDPSYICILPLLSNEEYYYNRILTNFKALEEISVTGSYSYLQSNNNQIVNDLDESISIISRLTELREHDMDAFINNCPSFWWLQNTVLNIPLWSFSQNLIFLGEEINIPKGCLTFISSYMQNIEYGLDK